MCTVRLQTKDVQYPSGSERYQTTDYSDLRALKLGVTPGLRSGGVQYELWLTDGKLSHSMSSVYVAMMGFESQPSKLDTTTL